MAKRDHKKKPTINDWHLWTEVTRSVSPLHKAKPLPEVEEAKAPPPATQTKKDKPLWAPGATPVYHQPAPQNERGFTFKRAEKISPNADIEPRIRRRLMRGQLPIDATIDLHGLRQSEAHAALCRFIAARHAKGDRTVLVITGKGLTKAGFGEIEQRGVLRAMLPRWLSEPALAPLVSGWQVSAQSHGGEGAYYVRLRRAGK